VLPIIIPRVIKNICRFENTTTFSIRSLKSKVEFGWSRKSGPNISSSRYISTTLSHAVREHLGGQEKVSLTNLDTFREEVSGLGSVFRSNKGSDLRDDVGSRVGVLAEETESTQHSQSAMLDFLDLLLVEFFRTVVQVEGVETRARSLSQLKVTRHSGGSLRLDQTDTSEFNQGENKDKLSNGLTGNVVEFLNGVDVGVSINSGPFVTREGSEKGRPDETNDSQLRDTSVGDLGFTQPLNISHSLRSRGLGVEEGRHRGGGESNGVETDITRKRSVKSGGATILGERKGGRRAVERNSAQGSAGNSLLGRSEGGRRSDQHRGDSELHG